MPGGQVFRARSCVMGMVSSCGLLALLAIPAALIVFGAQRGADAPLAILLLLAVPVLFFAALAPTMKYKVTGAEIIPSCGPFRWKIPIAAVQSIVERDLEWLPWSEGWKLPGYALFKIRYGQIGAVRMCATALTNRILIVDTGSELWGLTPADVDGFVAAVMERRPSPSPHCSPRPPL